MATPNALFHASGSKLQKAGVESLQELHTLTDPPTPYVRTQRNKYYAYCSYSRVGNFYHAPISHGYFWPAPDIGGVALLGCWYE
jgi:hypothetical protein